MNKWACATLLAAASLRAAFVVPEEPISDALFDASWRNVMAVYYSPKTGGIYHFPVVKRTHAEGETGSPYETSYCWGSCGWNAPEQGWACPPDVQWYWMDKVGTCIGEFPWTGIDYLDGSTVARRVRTFAVNSNRTVRASPSGFFDLAGFKKDLFYLYQSRYRPDLPMAHILPHWTWPGREGKVTPVYVFTSGDEGELFLNGRSLGRQKKRPGVWDKAYRLCWDDVKYEPGRLEVVVYRCGKEWARDAVRTAGPAARLVAEAENGTVAADGDAVAYVNVSVVDADGNLVPDASNVIRFSVEGPGELVATENGDTTVTHDFRRPDVAAFSGRAQGIVRAKAGMSGTIRVNATADNLAAAAAEIELVE